MPTVVFGAHGRRERRVFTVFSGALREADIFNEVALGMLFTGLEAGKVDEAFRRLEKQHAEEASIAIDRLSVIIPGIIYACVAIFVAILIIKIVAGYVGMINSI